MAGKKISKTTGSIKPDMSESNAYAKSILELAQDLLGNKKNGGSVDYDVNINYNINGENAVKNTEKSMEELRKKIESVSEAIEYLNNHPVDSKDLVQTKEFQKRSKQLSSYLKNFYDNYESMSTKVWDKDGQWLNIDAIKEFYSIMKEIYSYQKIFGSSNFLDLPTDIFAKINDVYKGLLTSVVDKKTGKSIEIDPWLLKDKYIKKEDFDSFTESKRILQRDAKLRSEETYNNAQVELANQIKMQEVREYRQMKKQREMEEKEERKRIREQKKGKQEQLRQRMEENNNGSNYSFIDDMEDEAEEMENVAKKTEEAAKKVRKSRKEMHDALNEDDDFEAEKAAKAAEEYAERQEKAYETVEEIKERVKKNYKKRDFTDIYSFNSSNKGGNAFIGEYSDDYIGDLKDASEKLKSQKENFQDAIKDWANLYNESVSEGNETDITSRKGYLEESIEELEVNLEKQEYIDRLLEAALQRQSEAQERFDKIRSRSQQSKPQSIKDIGEYNGKVYSDDWLIDESDANYHDKVKNVIESIKKEKEAIELDIQQSMKEYLNNYARDGQFDDYIESHLESNYEILKNYDEYIDFLSKQISDSQAPLTSGDSWGAENIQKVIDLIQELVDSIGNVSKAFGEIDENSGVSSLLSQLQSVAETIQNISKSIGVIGEGTTKAARGDIQSIRERLFRQRNDVLPSNLNIDLSGDSANSARKKEANELNEWRKQAERYTQIYDKIFEKYKNRDPVMNTPAQFLTGLYSGSQFLREATYGKDFEEVYSRGNVVTKHINNEDRVRSIMDFISDMSKALDETLSTAIFDRFYDEYKDNFQEDLQKYVKKTGSNDYDFSKWKELNASKIEQYLSQDEIYGGYWDVQKYLKSSASGSKDMKSLRAKMAEINDIKPKKVVDNEAPQEEGFMELIGHLSDVKDYTDAISELQAVLKKGLGISDNQEDKTYLQDLIDKIQQFSELFSKAGEDGTIMGISPEKIDNITSKFTELEAVLKQINGLLSSDNFKVGIKDITSPQSQRPTKHEEHEVVREKPNGDIVRHSSTTTSGGQNAVIPSEGISSVGSAAESADAQVRRLTDDIEELGTEARNISQNPLTEGVSESQEETKELSNTFDQIPGKANEIAKSIGESFGLTANSVKQLRSEIEELMNDVLNGKSVSFDSLKDIFYKDNNYKINAGDMEAQQIRQFLKGAKIKNYPEYKAEFGDDWQKVRNTLGIGVISNTKGQDADQFVMSMNEALGTQLDTSSHINALHALYDALVEVTDITKLYVDSMIEAGDISFSNIEDMITSGIKEIDPNAKIKSASDELFDELLGDSFEFGEGESSIAGRVNRDASELGESGEKLEEEGNRVSDIYKRISDNFKTVIQSDDDYNELNENFVGPLDIDGDVEDRLSHLKEVLESLKTYKAELEKEIQTDAGKFNTEVLPSGNEKNISNWVGYLEEDYTNLQNVVAMINYVNKEISSLSGEAVAPVIAENPVVEIAEQTQKGAEEMREAAGEVDAAADKVNESLRKAGGQDAGQTRPSGTDGVVSAMKEKTQEAEHENEVVNGAVTDEAGKFDRLREAIEKVTKAIQDKTTAVKNEGDAVSSTVSSEIQAFTSLLKEINYIVTDLSLLSDKIDGFPKLKLEIENSGEGTLFSKISSEFDEFIRDLQEKISIIQRDLGNIFENVGVGEQSPIKAEKIEAASDELKEFQQTYKDIISGLGLDFEGDLLGSMQKVKKEISDLWQLRKSAYNKDDFAFAEKEGNKFVALIDMFRKNFSEDLGMKGFRNASEQYLKAAENSAEKALNSKFNLLKELDARGGVNADLSDQTYSVVTQRTEEMVHAIQQAMQKAANEMSGEFSAFDALSGNIKEIVEIADQMTSAFETQAQTVSGAVEGESSAFEALSGFIYGIAEDINKLSNAIKELPSIDLKFEDFGEGSRISQITKDINELNKIMSEMGQMPLSKAQEQLKLPDLGQDAAKQAEESSNKIKSALQEIYNSYQSTFKDIQSKADGSKLFSWSNGTGGKASDALASHGFNEIAKAINDDELKSKLSSLNSKGLSGELKKEISEFRTYVVKLFADAQNGVEDAAKELYSMFSDDSLIGLFNQKETKSITSGMKKIDKQFGGEFKQTINAKNNMFAEVIKGIIPEGSIDNVIKQHLADVIPDNIMGLVQAEIMKSFDLHGEAAGSKSVDSITSTINEVVSSYEKLQKISGEGANAPAELTATIKESMEAAQSGAGSWAESLDKVESKARELGVAFEESSGQWKNISDIKEPQVSFFDVIETMIQKTREDLSGLVDYAKTLELTVDVKAPDVTLINKTITELKEMLEKPPILTVKVHNPETEPIIDGILTIKTLVGELKPIEVTVKDADFSPITKEIENLDKQIKKERVIEVSAKQLEIKNITEKVDEIQEKIKKINNENIKLKEIDASALKTFSSEVDKFIQSLDSKFNTINSKLGKDTFSAFNKESKAFESLKKIIEALKTYITEISEYFSQLGNNAGLNSFNSLVGKLETSINAFRQFSEILKNAKEQQEAMYKTQDASGETVGTSNVSKEIAKLEEMETVIDLVTAAVLQKNDAFSVEGTTVNNIVKSEIDALKRLQSELDSIADSIGALDSFFKELGDNSAFSGFSEMIEKIKVGEQGLKSFAEIIKKSKKQQEEALKNAEKAKEMDDKANEEKPKEADDNVTKQNNENSAQSVEKQAEAHEHAAEAAASHAEAAEKAGNAEKDASEKAASAGTPESTERQSAPSKLAEETKKFVNEAGKIFAEFDISDPLKDAPIEWQECLNMISNEGKTADEVLQHLRSTLESLGKEELNVDTRRLSHGEVYLNQQGVVDENENYSYTVRRGFAQRERFYHQVDEDGNAEVIPGGLTTNFEALEKEILKVDSIILRLQNDMNNAVATGKPTDGLTGQLEYYARYYNELIQELEQYYKDNDYMPDSYQVQDFNERRKRQGQLTSSQIQAINENRYSRDWDAAIKENQKIEKAKQKDIEDTNALIVKQQGALDNLKKKYVDNAGVNLASGDITKLEDQYKAITDLFDEIRGGKTSKEKKEQINAELKEYQRLAQQAIKNQKVDSQLAADSPQVARERLRSNIEETLEKMEKSAADTAEQEQRLRDLLNQLGTEYNPDVHTSSWLKEKGQEYRLVRQQNRRINVEYGQEDRQAKRYSQLTMKKARETNLSAEEQAELDQLTEKYNILNDIKKAGLEISATEEQMLRRVAAADEAAMNERIRLQQELQRSVEEYDYEQQRKQVAEENKNQQKQQESYEKQLRSDAIQYEKLLGKKAKKDLPFYELDSLERIDALYDSINQKKAAGEKLSASEEKFLQRIEQTAAKYGESLSHARSQQDQTDREKSISDTYDGILQKIENLKKASTELNNLNAEAVQDPEKRNLESYQRGLENYKKAAQEAAKALRELEDLHQNKLISDDLYNQAKLKNQQAQTGSAQSQKRFEEAQHKQAKDTIANQIKEISAAAEEYKNAQTKMNEWQAKEISMGKSVTELNEYQEAVERCTTAFERLEAAQATLESIKGKLTTKKFNELSKAIDDSMLGSGQSIDKIKAAEIGAVEAQVREQMAIIKEAEDAKSALNREEGNIANGRATSQNIDELRKKVEQLQLSAIKAADAISQILDDNEDKIGSNYEKWMNEMGAALNRSQEGSVASINAKTKAINQGKIREVKSDLTEYKKLMEDYQKLFVKDTLSSEEETRMNSDLSRMAEIEASWNAQKAEGLNLSKRQQEAEQQLSKIVKERSNGGNTKDMTKNMLEQDAIEKDAIAAFDKVQAKINNMYKQSDWRLPGWEDEIKKLQDQLDTLDWGKLTSKEGLRDFKRQLNTILAAQQKVQKSSDWQDIGRDWQSKQHADLAKWMNQNKDAAKAFREELENLDKEIDEVGSKGMAEEWTAKYQDIIKQAADRDLLGKSMGDRFKDQFKNTMTSLATYYLSFQDFVRYGREAISMITELDTQLTEMRKVSNESLSTLRNYQLETFDIADKVGTTAAQIQSSTADWMRLGKSLPEASEMAALSTKLLNVSEFTDINEATQAMVSSTQAYSEVAASDIVDKLNLIGNNFAVSTDQLAQGLQNAAAVLKTQGNDLDQALALLTAGNAITQDMSKTSAGIFYAVI